MDFDLSPVQRRAYADIVAGTRERFGKTAIAASGSFAGRDAWRAAADLGLTGMCLPTQYGGGGLGALDTALGLEAFGAGGADAGLAFGIAAHLLACGVTISEFAGKEVRGDLLHRLCTGEAIAANAMTEDDAGSDLSRLATTAVRQGDAYVLNGAKSFVSNAPIADLLVTYAVTSPDAGYLGISAFAVPRSLPGIAVSAPMSKMGLHGCAAARIEFSECRVPIRYRLGAEGQGSVIFQRSMCWERACLPAIYLGTMDQQLGRCAERTRERRQFGRPIGRFQAISHRLATMKQRLEGARLLLYRACWLLDRGREDPTVAAALSKVAVTEAAVANSLDAIQIFGASGYLTDTGIEQQLRDAVPSTIFSGTTEIQKEIIARSVGE